MEGEFDVLSYQQRKPRIHILTLDRVLADDIYERLRGNVRTRYYELITPKKFRLKERIAEIEESAEKTTAARMFILDVRKTTLAALHQGFNKITGYNRKDLNKYCFTVLVGDGPLNLFTAGKSIDVFVPYLAKHRTDYNPAAFFYDPFIHYEPDELEVTIDGELTLPVNLPQRLESYFPEPGVTVDSVRRYFRGAEENEGVRKQRVKVLAALFLKRISRQFPEQKDRLRELLSKDGLQLASERLNIYPLFFEDWVHELMQKAASQT
ncbi:MAG: hypothetical protein JW749_12900 [Sedimentisphaerales bacterium]|nr:hypothetical protein [Sedimentisphaerales bacterium]